MGHHRLASLALIASMACFLIALAISLNVITAWNETKAWAEGGFLALVLALLLER